MLGPGNVSTVDTQSNRISGSVNLGPREQTRLNRGHTHRDVRGQPAAGTVTVINPSSSKITATVTVGDSPYGIAVSP